MLIFIYLFLTGLFVGLISSFFGVGGGIIAIPILYFVFPKVPPQVIMTCSMGMIFINSLINIYNFKKKVTLQSPKILFFMMISMGVGVTISSNIAHLLSAQTLKIIFASITFIVALRTAYSVKKKRYRENYKLFNENNISLKSPLITFLGGIVIGLTGLGGGAVMVPMFIGILKMPYKWIPLYSNLMMGVGTLIGLSNSMLRPYESHFQNNLFTHLQVGHANWGIILILCSGAVITSRIGVRYSQRITPLKAKALFATLLFIVSLKIFYSAVFVHFFT